MTTNRHTHRKVEILSPAGSYECFLAAIAAGADAVYAGGPCFGARAFADNFTEEKLLEAIDYAHLHDRSFYLTVNTLLKDTELDRLQSYLEPLYRHGLDAVIVQDMGVLSYIRTHFPELAVHASTQTTVTNAEGALFMKEQGVERVVPARELSLKEVREIYDRTGMEVECFVHGALCYCYSGQCLLSSFIGGRSGNRGQCAQPCRLPYSVNGTKEYVMSLKDICTLDLIPDMIEAGIYSFKIEGRMKKPEYVASVTSMYRKYTDLYLKKGRKGYKVRPEDKEKLMDIYNRGGFSDGYYKQHNGKNMLSLDRPNHAGVPAVKVVSQKGREVTCVTLTEIHRGDVLGLSLKKDDSDGRNNYTFGKDVSKGTNVQFLLPKGMRCSKGTVFSRLRNQSLLDEIQSNYIGKTVQEPASGYLDVTVGQPAMLTVICRDISVTAVTEELTEEAMNQPVDPERLKKQLKKTGTSSFYFENLEAAVNGNAFLPMQRINELRRQALSMLEEAVCSEFRRDAYTAPETELSVPETEEPLYISALAETKEQLQALSDCEDVKRIYVDSNICLDFFNNEETKKICRSIKESGKELFLAMPHIFRENAISYFKKNVEKIEEYAFDGALIRNYESYHYLMSIGFDRRIILDHNLYVFNKEAKKFWQSLHVTDYTVPAELNEREIKGLQAHSSELIGYGRMPVMVSAQCITKTTSKCTKTPGIVWMSDRCQKSFPVRNCCNFCYNVHYHSEPQYLLDCKEEILNISPCGIRLQFTLEDAKSVKKIVKECADIYFRGKEPEEPEFPYTRGHFNRGIN